MREQGKSPGEICAQLKDRNRNGRRDLALLHEHLAKDELIAWGWNPGLGREPVPGTQARLGPRWEVVLGGEMAFVAGFLTLLIQL